MLGVGAADAFDLLLLATNGDRGGRDLSKMGKFDIGDQVSKAINADDLSDQLSLFESRLLEVEPLDVGSGRTELVESNAETQMRRNRSHDVSTVKGVANGRSPKTLIL